MESSLSLARRQVLELLSAALHDRVVDTDLFADMTADDWKAVEQLAQEQSILGLVANRILSLPQELLPERQHRLELALSEELITRHYKAHTKALQVIYQEYEDRGLYPVVLKGLTMSQLYPQPHLRSLGDLDLFLPLPGSYQSANDWARTSGYPMEEAALYEQAYRRGKMVIENHLYLTYFGIPKYDKALSNIIEGITARNAWDDCLIEGKSYRVLPLELNAVYTFHHILHHFSYLGIGLRQICDWVLLMQGHSKQMDAALVEDYARQLDLMRPMQLFALMAIRHLGVSADAFPFDIPQDANSQRLADLIIDDTFRGGNFGFEHFSGRSFSNKWSRRWFMFRQTTLRSLRVAEVSPEHIRLIPLIAIANRIKLLFKH